MKVVFAPRETFPTWRNSLLSQSEERHQEFYYRSISAFLEGNHALSALQLSRFFCDSLSFYRCSCGSPACLYCSLIQQLHTLTSPEFNSVSLSNFLLCSPALVQLGGGSVVITGQNWDTFSTNLSDYINRYLSAGYVTRSLLRPKLGFYVNGYWYINVILSPTHILFSSDIFSTLYQAIFRAVRHHQTLRVWTIMRSLFLTHCRAMEC